MSIGEFADWAYDIVAAICVLAVIWFGIIKR